MTLFEMLEAVFEGLCRVGGVLCMVAFAVIVIGRLRGEI